MERDIEQLLRDLKGLASDRPVATGVITQTEAAMLLEYIRTLMACVVTEGDKGNRE